LTVDPDEGSRTNSENGNASRGTPTKQAAGSEVCSPGDQSATLHVETQGPTPITEQQNEVTSVVVPMAGVNDKETLILSGAETGGAEEINDGEDQEKWSKTETAAMATPQKDGRTAALTESNMFVSPNLMASPCSSEGSSQRETEQHDDTVRKEGTEGKLGASNASRGVKHTDTDEMRWSDIRKTNGATARLSPIAHESKVGEKTIEEDIVGTPRVDEAAPSANGEE
jgi:hypothetical protein